MGFAALSKTFGLLLVLLGTACTYLLLYFDPHRAAHLALPATLRPFRPLPIRLANAAHRAAKQTLGVELVELDPDSMLRAACEEVAASGNTPCDYGVENWGDFEPAFRTFVRSMENEADLTLIGRVFVLNRAKMFLKQRLQLVEFWKNSSTAQPTEVAPVLSPLFVIGLPRTGTTFLHTLLAQDIDTFMSPLNWMVVDPSPPATFGNIDEDIGTATGERRAKMDAANFNLDQFKQIAENIDAQHVMSAFNPEECIVFMGHTWVTFEFMAYMGQAKTYSNWLRDLPSYADAFKWHRQILSHLASAAPIDKERDAAQAQPRRWVLKTPFHMGMLDDLVREYPDADIIMTHRRPVRSMTSLSSLQSKLSSVCTDNLAPRVLAEHYMNLWDTFAAKAVATREAWADAGPAHPQYRTLDINLRELHEAPMDVVARIYERYGLTLSEAARSRMESWLQGDGSRGKHGKNVYKAEWFGLEDRAAVLQAHPGLQRYDDYFCAQFENECA